MIYISSIPYKPVLLLHFSLCRLLIPSFLLYILTGSFKIYLSINSDQLETKLLRCIILYIPPLPSHLYTELLLLNKTLLWCYKDKLMIFTCYVAMFSGFCGPSTMTNKSPLGTLFFPKWRRLKQLMPFQKIRGKNKKL